MICPASINKGNNELVFVITALLLASPVFFQTAFCGQVFTSSSLASVVSIFSRLLHEGSRLLPRPSATPVFIGGEVVDDRPKFGFAARILARYSEYNGKLCSGALIHPQWVITAAHCVTRTANASGQPHHGLDVYLGDLTVGQLEPNEQQYTAWAEIHPAYDPQTRKNDIAMLKLAKPAKLDSHTFPIPLSKKFSISSATWQFPTDPTSIHPEVLKQGQLLGNSSERLMFAGWGQAGNHTEPIKLRFAELTELSVERCRSALISTGFVNRMHQSSSCYMGSRKDACFGDDGGPVVSITPNGKLALVAIHSTYAAPTQKSFSGLAGISSSQMTPPGGTVARCRQGSPNVATKIEPYSDFIYSVLTHDVVDAHE